MRTELPKKWCFKLKRENTQEVCNYVISNKPSYTNWIPSNILVNPYITNQNFPLVSTQSKYGEEITFEEFKSLVLGEKQQPTEPQYEIY
jgi:hypothetical protein